MATKIDAKSLGRLADQLKAAEKGVKASYRKGLKEVGQIIADDAKARIVEHSPPTAALIKVRTRLPATVSVQGGSKDHVVSGLLEGSGHEGYWSHPLFGDEKKRYPEQRHPHLLPAYEAHKDEAVDALKKHVTEAINGAGIEGPAA